MKNDSALLGNCTFKILLLLAASLLLPTTSSDAWSANAEAKPAVERELIPGADNMSSSEREGYRKRMANAATPEQQAKVRAEYAAAAKEQARAITLVGDPARGASLHRACFYCHGIERYVAPMTYAATTFIDSVLRASGLSDIPPQEPTRFRGRVKSIAELRDGVNRRNDYLSPKLTEQEVEDIVAYLNVTYYKFPQ